MEEKEENLGTEVCLLDEYDISGASLNGKSPSQLNVVQLK